MPKDYILYQLGDTFTTVEKLTDDNKIFNGISLFELYSFKDEVGFTNLERIFYNLSPTARAKTELENKFIKALVAINNNDPSTFEWNENYTEGTVIVLPIDKVNLAVAARDGGNDQIVGYQSKERGNSGYTDSKVFMAENLIKTIEDNDNLYLNPEIEIEGKDGSRIIKEIPSLVVKIWCRAMQEGNGDRDDSGSADENENTSLSGTWIDVTKYVISINTNTDRNGGNFQLQLAPTKAKWDSSSDSWSSDYESIMTTSKTRGANVVRTPLYKDNKLGFIEGEDILFDRVLQENDLVYISYEGNNRFGEENHHDNIAKKDTYGDTFPPRYSWSDEGKVNHGGVDMIALIDTVTRDFTPASAELNISVQGRDLSKLIIEDGSYMYSSLWDGHNFFLERDNGLLRRNLGKQAKQVYNFYSQSRYLTIRESVSFILNVLSNIKVVPDEVVNQAVYRDDEIAQGFLTLTESVKDDTIEDVESVMEKDLKDRVTKWLKQYGTDYKSLDKPDAEALVTKVMKQMVGWAKRLEIDPVLASYIIKYDDYNSLFPDMNFPKEKSNTHSAYFGGKVDGWRNDDWSNRTDLIVDAALNVSRADEPRSKRDKISRVSYGIWGLVKLVFDDSIADRKLVDSSLGSPDGSIISLIRTWVQEPWVEMLLDTYGEFYHMVFRKPPHSKESIREYISTDLFDKTKIHSSAVISESLSWETEVYSLYRLNYKAASWGGSSQLAAVIPTVPLPDYAEMYGNRKWEASSNFIPVSQTDDNVSAASRTAVREQGIDDLVWVIETKSYLPFTRRGTLTIKGSNIYKKGMWVYYAPTREIYYIDAVRQSFSSANVDRQTVLTVSRGMVLEYVKKGRQIQTKNHGVVDISYFDILNIDKLKSGLKNKLPDKTAAPSSDDEATTNDEATDTSTENSSTESDQSMFNVIPEVFNFFVKRAQFANPNLTLPLISTTPDFEAGAENKV